MPEPVVFVGTRGKIVDVALQLSAMIAGRATDRFGVARGFLLSIGFAALSDIRQAYEIKSKGGTDAMGIKWPPLKPATIANRRVGPRDLRNAAIKEREKIRKREFKKAFQRMLLSLPEKQARARANQIASLRATAQTGRTKVDVLGNRVVEILRDRGIMFNSFGPGLLLLGETPSYRKPSEPGGEQQILEVQPGQVIVGSNVAYAAKQNNGDPSMNLPARKILPAGSEDVPEAWWENWFDAAGVALVASARLLYQAESGR